MRFLFFLSTLAFLLAAAVHTPLAAQILDDSTKMKYNASSVVMQSEEDVYYNRSRVLHPGTSLHGIQSYQPLFVNNVYSQDLGNYLTPRGRVVPVTPATIGGRYGFMAFDDFALPPDSVLYYDTRSPYTELDYVQGSKGQQHIYVTHSRNVTARWNVTALIRRMSSRKLLGAQSRTERQAENWTFGLASRYYSKDARYQLLGQVISVSHKHYDQGGIAPSLTDSTNSDLYDYDLAQVNLYQVKTTDRRITARVYQQYGLRGDSSLQVFAQLDFQSRLNQYLDDNTGGNAAFYPAIYNDSVYTRDKVSYTQGEMKAGIKGMTRSMFYSAYYRGRYYKYEILNTDISGLEGFNPIIGAEWIGKFGKSLYAGVNGEWMVTGPQRLLEAKLYHRLFELRYRQMQYTATFQEQLYGGNHVRWDNAFNYINLQQAEATARIRWGALKVTPVVKWMRFNNYVYMNQLARPEQFNSDLDVWTSTVNVGYSRRLWIFENAFQYNFTSDENILRVPELINRTRLLLQGYLFKKATFMQVGTDIFFRSAWVGNRYMPVTQLYYLGNPASPFSQLESYALFDVFVNMQVKTARFFVKMAYLNQGMGSNGYMVTPYYSGMVRTFEFGINWQFFD